MTKFVEIKFVPGSFQKGFGANLYYPGFDTLEAITVIDVEPITDIESLPSYETIKGLPTYCDISTNVTVVEYMDNRIGNADDVTDEAYDQFVKMHAVIRQVLRAICMQQYPEEHMDAFKDYAKTLLRLYGMTENEFIDAHYMSLRNQLESRQVQSVFDL